MAGGREGIRAVRSSTIKYNSQWQIVREAYVTRVAIVIHIVIVCHLCRCTVQTNVVPGFNFDSIRLVSFCYDCVFVFGFVFVCVFIFDCDSDSISFECGTFLMWPQST